MKYAEVIFLQGYEATEALAILENEGREEALNHLMQWDYGEDHNLRDRLPAGTSDRSFSSGDYVMNWNAPLEYIGLVREVANENE